MARGVKGSRVCGTHSGYKGHRLRGEEACEPCREALRTYMRAYNAKRNKAKTKPRPQPIETSTVTVAIRCPLCASDVVEENRRQMRSELVTIVRCTKQTCAYTFVARMVIVPITTDHKGEPTKCGTASGYQRHRRAGEEACEQCRQAHSQRQRDLEVKRKAAA